MHKFRITAIGLAATLLFAASPATHAQSQDDLQLMQTFLNIMSDYFEIIEATYQVSSNPEKAAIMQMQKIQEVYEQRGEKARATAVFREVLSQSDNPTIRNAAFILLGDNLKESGRSDEALEALRQGLDENIKAAQ